MDQKRPLLSLIIAVYKKPDFLERVLLSCLNQSMKDFEIVISDDGSGDDIRQVLAKYGSSFSYPIQHCWHEDDGFRKTIIANKAAVSALADYLVFIDGDCILHHGFMHAHARYREKNVVLSGRRVRLDGEITAKITHDDIVSRRVERLAFWRKHCPAKDIRHGIYIPHSTIVEQWFSKKPRRILGSNFSLHKQDFLAINGYDERIIGRGMEDSNLHERAVLHGIQFKSVVREAVQYHMFHSFDPIPHSAEIIQEFCHPKQSWTPHGVVKGV